MPQVVNPKSGYIVGCNQQVVPLNYKHLVGTAMSTTGRSYRVDEILRERTQERQIVDVEFMKQMQVEDYDALARELCKVLIPFTEKRIYDYYVLKSDAAVVVEHMLDIVKKWDYVASEDSKETLIFKMWISEILDGFLQEQIPDAWTRKLVSHVKTSGQFLGKSLQNWSKGFGLNSTYCLNDRSRNKKDPCAYNVVHGLYVAYQKIANTFGTSESNWKWGYKNVIRSLSDSFSSTPLRLFFERLYLSSVFTLSHCRERLIP